MNISKAMILAAGFGKRMLPESLNKPKPLFKLNDKTLLEYSVEFLHELKISEIIVNTHYLHEQIEDFIDQKKLNIQISFEEKILDTGGGIVNNLDFFQNKDFIVINSDTVWTSSYQSDVFKLLDIYFANNSKAGLLLAKPENSFDTNLLGDFDLVKNNFINKSQKKIYFYWSASIAPQYFFNQKQR
jgi:MurNAc alpha-1-phosphate uridylyltransferase